MRLFDTGPIDLFQPVCADHPLNRGRIAWWISLPGLAGGKTFQDLCGKSPGLLTGMGSDGGWRGSTRPGGFGHLLFDGTDDYVDLGSNSVLGSATVTAALWVNAANFGAGSRYLLADFDTAGNVSNFGISQLATSKFLVYQYIDGASVTLTSTTARNSGEWYRLLFVRDDVAKTYAIYVNGRLDSVVTSYSGSVSALQRSKYLGRSSPEYGDYFPGAIDDVSLWSRALSAEEIRADYDLSQCGYPGLLARIAPRVMVATPAAASAPVDRQGAIANPHTLSGTKIEQIASASDVLSAHVHRQSAHAENGVELWYYRDGGWHLFPIQPLTGPDRGLELTQSYKQPATLAFTLPDPDGLYAAENLESPWNYLGDGSYHPLLDEARKILLRVGTRCYTNLAAGVVPTASAAATLGTLAKLTDGALTDWTGGVPFDSGAAFAFSGTAPSLDITVDTGVISLLLHAAIRFGTRILGFTLPASVTVQVSVDGSTWKSWPARPVGGPLGDWAESVGGQSVEIAVCDLDTTARYVRFRVVGVDGTTSLGVDEVAVYGGRAARMLGANLFVGYMGDSIDFTPAGRVECVAVDVLKKLADNNDVFLTAAYRMTTAGIELGDIVYSLLTSSAYWSGEGDEYNAPLTADEIGWDSGDALTGLRYPLWQGQTNSSLGYCQELFAVIGWHFFADGNGVLQATEPAYLQRLPDRVCIAGVDGNTDVWGCKRHRTGKNMRNRVIVQTGKSKSAGSGYIKLSEPNSVARFGTRTTRITDPLASTPDLRKKVAEFFLRDYAWNLQSLTSVIRPQFETALKDIFGFRAQARPNLYAKASTISLYRRKQELWSLMSLHHSITVGQWTADCEWVPYVAQPVASPNFKELNAVGGNPTGLEAFFDPITDPLVVYIKFYVSTVGEFGPWTLHALYGSVATSSYPIAGLPTATPVWVYLTAVDAEGNESIPSQILSATPGSLSQAITCYTIDDFTVDSILTEGPDAQGYYTYQFLCLWNAPACGFTQSDVRAYVGTTPPADAELPDSWPLHDDDWNWWGADRILENRTWNNVDIGQLDFVITFRSQSNLTGLKMWWRIWNSSRTRAWRPVPGVFDSTTVL